MPTPISTNTMTRFIEGNLAERGQGEGVLFASFNASGEATAYVDVQFSPQRSIARFGGACGLAAVEWCFDQRDVVRTCETTAHDDGRSIRPLSRLGFIPRGR